MKVGLALGGGGARGLAHIGVLKILERESIPIDIICGTSMGAVIGSVYACNPDADKLEKLVKDFYKQHKIKGGWLEFLSKPEEDYKKKLFSEMSYHIRKKYMAIVAMRKISLEPESTLREPLMNFLKNCNCHHEMSTIKTPFASVAINLTEGHEEIFTTGPLIDAVYASSSIEGFFPPLHRYGNYYSDGGPVSYVPVDACRKLGADLVIAVYLPTSIKRVDDFSNGLEIIFRADSIANLKLSNLLLQSADIVIKPEVEDVHWAAFQRINECIALGEKAAEGKITEIKRIIKEHKAPLSKIRRYLRSKI